MNHRSYYIPSIHDDGFVNESQTGNYRITEFTFQGNDKWLLYAKSVEAIKESHLVRPKPPIILLHGGGPDHESLLPLAKLLARENTIILPDIRGYGHSECTDPQYHTWLQYSSDVITLLDKIHAGHAIIGGAGLGSTIALRTALAHHDRVAGLILISVEDIEDDKAKAAEIVFMEEFAKRVKSFGLKEAWEPILTELSPVIRSMVEDAIPRTNPESAIAAASIGYDRSFKNINELSSISTPTLIIPGMDWRHPEHIANRLASVIPNSYVSSMKPFTDLKNPEDFALFIAPLIQVFLQRLRL